MSREELLALAERVEQATGPDRELDCAVRMAVYAPEGATMEQSPINGNWCIYSGKSFRTGKPALWESHLGRNQAFTASLDAAMSLVGEQHRILTINEQDIDDERPWVVRLTERHAEFGRAKVTNAIAATPALALVAASLRARAMGEGL